MSDGVRYIARDIHSNIRSMLDRGLRRIGSVEYRVADHGWLVSFYLGQRLDVRYTDNGRVSVGLSRQPDYTTANRIRWYLEGLQRDGIVLYVLGL